jgi:hypothetical protein
MNVARKQAGAMTTLAPGPVAETGISGAVGNIAPNPCSKFTTCNLPSSAKPTPPTRVPTL